MKDWWGDAGQARLLSDDDIIRVEQMEVLDHFGLLVETDGKLYVREEYKMMFARLSNARTTDTPCVIPGVVLTGNLGTGTSLQTSSAKPDLSDMSAYARQVLLCRIRPAPLLGR